MYVHYNYCQAIIYTPDSTCARGPSPGEDRHFYAAVYVALSALLQDAVGVRLAYKRTVHPLLSREETGNTCIYTVNLITARSQLKAAISSDLAL